MKKFMMLAIAAMALLAVSCQKETDEDLPIFTAHADNGGMKTDLVGNLIHWNNTDQVKMFGSQGYAVYSVTPRTDDPTWATLSPISNNGLVGLDHYRFVYPASMAEGGTANNATLYVNFPAERNIGDAPLTYFPMYGESDNQDVAFRNLGGLIKLVMPEIGQEILQIRISTDEPNNGKYRIGNDCGLEYAGANTAADKTVIVQAGGRTFAQGDCVYVAIPAGEYHHFTIEIITNNQRATKVGSLVDVLPSAFTTITLSNLVFEDYWWPATLQERAFYELEAESLIFHYNYTDAVSSAERIDINSSDPDATPIYKKIVNNVCHVYTPASEIYAPANSSYLFAYNAAYFNPLTQIDFGDGFNTSNVTNMSYMFCNSDCLTSLDLSSFNTENVTNMKSMFDGCFEMTSLNVSSFNTANVTDMSSMFIYCEALTSLDLSSFNTANVTNMGYMFYWCSALTSLDLSSFSSNSLGSFWFVFEDCTALQSLQFSNSFTLNNNMSVGDALDGVGTTCTITIKCNSQTKDRLLYHSHSGNNIVWDLY